MQCRRIEFAMGFLTAAVLGLVWLLLANFQFVGGHTQNSPSGKYRLSIMAPQHPTLDGTYVITLVNNATERDLRSATVKLGAGEQTKSLRGLPVTMNWDSSESYADILVDGDFLMRMSVPASLP